MPPLTSDYLGYIQSVTNYYANTGLLNNSNVYFVLAVYVRENNPVHFLSTGPNDRNSIESTVKWLNAYRNHTPIGYQDLVINSTCRTGGWAVDQDTPQESINVHVYADSPAGSGILLGSYPTNVLRNDVNQALGITGNHGFDIIFSQQHANEAILFDNKSHPLYIYAIDSRNPVNNNALLTNSPKTITCVPPTPTPPPSLSLFPGWNQIAWPDVSGKKASDIPIECPIAVSKENFWFVPYVKNFGGVNFNFESGKTYYIKCNQAISWNLE